MYPKFLLNVVIKKQNLLSRCCEKVRGNTDVPKGWSDCSAAETKLEASKHKSLQKSVQCFIDINIKFCDETDGTDSHLAPFHC
jgi:hypothetical protein